MTEISIVCSSLRTLDRELAMESGAKVNLLATSVARRLARRTAVAYVGY
jgi:hypothetical protein